MRRERCLLAVLLVAAVLLFSAIDQHAFWADEAITAFYGRSIFSQGRGRPCAWDGRNLVAFGAGTSLNEDMIPTAYPLLQFYLAAPFFALLGKAHETLAGRLPFALLGLATVPMTYLLALRWTRNRAAGLASAVLLATSVSFLLFSRQCRYYAPTMFLTALLLWLYPGLERRRAGPLIGFIVCGLLFFHSHFLVFYAFMGGLVLAYLAADRSRNRLGRLALAGVVLLALTVPYWRLVVGGGLPRIIPSQQGSAEVATPAKRLVLFGWYLREMNRAAFFPLLALPLLLTILPARDDGRWRVDKAPLFFLALIVGQVAFTCLVSPQPVEPGKVEDADIRYVANLLPLTCVLLGMIGSRLWRWKRPAAVAFVGIVVFTNLLALERPRSYLLEYVYELTHDYDTGTELVITALSAGTRPDDIVLVAPGHQRDPLIFYLGDRLRFAGVLPADESRILPAQGNRLPAYLYSADVIPDWIVTFGRRDVREDLHRAMVAQDIGVNRFVINAHRQDGNRPELFWHRFRPPQWVPEKDRIFVYEVGKPARH